MTFNQSVKPVPGLPEFRWNQVARRYIDYQGRFVSEARIRSALDTYIDAQIATAKNVSIELANGNLTLGEWRTQMRVVSKNTNLAGGALERGGWYNMSNSDFGKVGRKIRDEYGYIENFASEIASGNQPLDGTLWNRATLYGDQGRVTYYDFADDTATQMGMDEESSRRTPADSCNSCIDEENKGWQPRGEIIPIGSRTCLSRCHCFMRYRNSITGQIRTV